MTDTRAVIIITLATLALVAAAVFRGQHPPGHDELNFLDTGLRMLGSKGNPGWFLHGSFLYDLMAVLQGGTYLIWSLAGNGWDPDKYLEFYLAHKDLYLLAGRFVVVMFAIALLVALNRLATLLYGGHAGPLAMALLGFGALWLLSASPLKEDIPAGALGVLSVLVLFDSSLELRTSVRWGLSGVLCGVAIATKYTMASLVLVPVIMALTNGNETPRRLLAVFLSGAGIGFLAVEPFVFLDVSHTMSSLQVLRGLSESGRRVMAPRYLFDFLPLGLGIPLVIAVIPAMLSALFRHDWRLRAIVVYLCVGTAMCLFSTFSSPRYFMPVAPFLCMIVAGEVCRLEILKAEKALATASLAIILAWPANVLALKYLVLLSRPDTRHISQAWIESQVPINSKILLEGTVTLEPTFAPALVPTAEWFEAKQQEAQALGATGRVFRAAASRAAQSGRPRYRIVENDIEDVPDLDLFDYVVLSSFDALPGEWQYIVDSHDPEIEQGVSKRQAALRLLERDFLEEFSSKPAPNLKFDWVSNNPDFWGMWVSPLWSCSQWTVGPHIQVYRRLQKQTSQNIHSS